MSFRSVRYAYVVALVALLVVHLFGSATAVVTTALTGALSLSAVGAGVVTLRPARRWAWVMLGAGVVLFSAGTVLSELDGARPDYPSSADLLYLAGYVPVAVGLVLLGRPGQPSKDWLVMLDTVALTLAGGLLVWVTLVRPAVVAQSGVALSTVVAVASWIGYMGVLAACVRVVLIWRSNRAIVTLAVGVAGLLVSDYVYGRARLGLSGVGSADADLGLLLFIGLVGAAALMPSMARLSVSPYRPEAGLWRLSLLAVALLAAPTVLLAEATPGPVTTGVAIAVVSAVVGLLMLVRVTLGARAYRARAVADLAVRTASRSMAVATTTAEVVASLTAALHRMLPHDPGCEVRLLDVADGHIRPAPAGSVITGPERGPGELLVRIGAEALPVSRGYAIVFTGPTHRLRDLAPTLEALADQAGSTLARIDLMAALRAEERERYFRTLVLTSTDATLICRNGRVDYATPSAHEMFGRDVLGASMEGLIETPATGSVADSDSPQWTNMGAAVEGRVNRPDGTVRTVLVHRRDLTRDPTVNGVVATIRDVTAERELQRSLAYRASHDALTGLANADRLRERMRAGRDAAEAGTLSAVLFVDLDDFKNINDTYGHDIGDGLLVSVANRIQHGLRGEDVAARLGGDEFAVLLRDIPDDAAARRTAQRIADTLARPVDVGGVSLDSRASVGLAIARTPAEFDSLLRRADTALYTAKEDGKGRWRQYEEGMVSPVRRRTDLRIELENAMRDHSLALNYQPIVDLATGRVAGFEALIRLHRGDLAPMPPQELIRIAEENGLIGPVGDWVIERALSDLARLNPPGVREPRYVSLNVSPVQLRQPDFVAKVRDRLRGSDVDPKLLVIEITERLLVAEDAQAWGYLAELRRDGVRVAIDDYGTGCASLSYLRQPAIDIVKIDRSFLHDLAAPHTKLLLAAVVRLCASLGLAQVAEGIEVPQARDMLRDLGCRYGQGFLFAPALTVDDAAGWLEPGAELARSG